MLYPFIKDGFEYGEKVFHVVDPQRTDEYLQRGYTDSDFPANKLRIGRDPVAKHVVFLDN